MAWCLTGNKLLSEAMLVCFTDAYMHHSASMSLTHWGRVTHICVSRLTITGSDNGLSPGRRQAILWTNNGILLIGPLGTNCKENLSEILTFLFMKMRLKVSSAKWRPFCLSLNVLTETHCSTLHESTTSCPIQFPGPHPEFPGIQEVGVSCAVTLLDLQDHPHTALGDLLVDLMTFPEYSSRCQPQQEKILLPIVVKDIQIFCTKEIPIVKNWSHIHNQLFIQYSY